MSAAAMNLTEPHVVSSTVLLNDGTPDTRTLRYHRISLVLPADTATSCRPSPSKSLTTAKYGWLIVASMTTPDANVIELVPMFSIHSTAGASRTVTMTSRSPSPSMSAVVTLVGDASDDASDTELADVKYGAAPELGNHTASPPDVTNHVTSTSVSPSPSKSTTHRPIVYCAVLTLLAANDGGMPPRLRNHWNCDAPRDVATMSSRPEQRRAHTQTR
jgi:hypothetical protein